MESHSDCYTRNLVRNLASSKELQAGLDYLQPYLRSDFDIPWYDKLVYDWHGAMRATNRVTCATLRTAFIFTMFDYKI